MKNKRLMELAGLTESNDETMHEEEMKDISKAVVKAWDRAKRMGMEFKDFSDTVKSVCNNALEDAGVDE